MSLPRGVGHEGRPRRDAHRARRLCRLPGSGSRPARPSSRRSRLSTGRRAAAHSRSSPSLASMRGAGSGVTPIKHGLMTRLKASGWKLEERMAIAARRQPGKIDAVLFAHAGPVALEWETGNISSSHRALNKMALVLLHGTLAAAVLVVPSRALYRFLTDRIGNWDELRSLPRPVEVAAGSGRGARDRRRRARRHERRGAADSQGYGRQGDRVARPRRLTSTRRDPLHAPRPGRFRRCDTSRCCGHDGAAGRGSMA